MTRFWFIFIITLLALGMSTFSSGVRGETILDFYALALQHDTKLKNASYSMKSALARLDQSKSWLKPQLQLNTSQIYNHVDYGIVDEDYSSTSFNLFLTQSVFDYSRWVKISETEAYVTQEEAFFASAKQDLIIRVVTAYFDLLTAKESLELAQAEKRTIGQQLNHSKQRFEAGFLTVADVIEAQAAYDKAIAQEISAQSNLDIAKEAVFAISGHSLDSSARLKANIPLAPPEPKQINSWIELALQNNLDILAQRAVVEAANQALIGAKAEYYPTISLVTGYNYKDSIGAKYGEDSDTSFIGVELVAQLYNGGMTAAKVEETSQQCAREKNTLEQIRRSTISKTRGAYLAITLGIAKIQANHQALLSARASSKATQEGFKVGKRTIVDMLDAQRNLFQAQYDLIHSRYEYLLAVITLKQAVGNLQESDLESIFTLFEET